MTENQQAQPEERDPRQEFEMFMQNRMPELKQMIEFKQDSGEPLKLHMNTFTVDPVDLLKIGAAVKYAADFGMEVKVINHTETEVSEESDE